MADIKQFQRSKDRINELLHNLMYKKSDDPEVASYIKSLEKALEILELKMDEYLRSLNSNKGHAGFGLCF